MVQWEKASLGQLSKTTHAPVSSMSTATPVSSTSTHAHVSSMSTAAPVSSMMSTHAPVIKPIRLIIYQAVLERVFL